MHPGEEADPPSPEYCLVAVLKPFMTSLPVGSQFGLNGWHAFGLLQSDYSAFGWTSEDTDLVLFGRPLCGALSLDRSDQFGAQLPFRSNSKMRWCHTPLGYIGYDRAAQLRQKARQVREHLINSDSLNFRAGQRNVPIDYPINAFKYVEGLFAACDERDKVLLVTVSS